MVVEDAAMETLTGTFAVIVMDIAFDVAGLLVLQLAFEVSTQVTISLFDKPLLLKVGLFVPTLDPFTFHWYTGVVPPFTGVAVNVTMLPWQTGFCEALILMLAGWAGKISITIKFEVAGLPETQVSSDVMTQLTMSPSSKELLLNVTALAPVFTPFTFHWYCGEFPPFTAVAVKITRVPSHTVFSDSLIVTDALTVELTITGVLDEASHCPPFDTTAV